MSRIKYLSLYFFIFLFLEDQRSKNTSSLNGKAVDPFSPQKLKSGDEITFDTYKFIFLLEHQTPAGDTEKSL